MTRTTPRHRIEVWMYVKDPGKLRRRRKAKGFSQKQLASLVDCTQQYISLIEAGVDRDVSEKIGTRIARWLDCDLEDLFDERTVVPTAAVPSTKPVDGDAA